MSSEKKGKAGERCPSFSPSPAPEDRVAAKPKKLVKKTNLPALKLSPAGPSLPVFVGGLPEGAELDDVVALCQEKGWAPIGKNGAADITFGQGKAIIHFPPKMVPKIVATTKADVAGTVVTLKTTTDAQKVIQRIRGSWGIDLPVDASVQKILQKYRGSLAESLRLLSEELYADNTHFLLELLQNADDNTYAKGVAPTFELRLQGDTLQILNNEIGFSEPNMNAICDSGRSTKAAKTGFIGEKGIGFKSVFAVTSTPTIVSNEYCFQFRLTKEDPMGYVVPHSCEHPDEIVPLFTNIILPLKASLAERVTATLQLIEHPILLFLRQLRNLRIRLSDGKTIDISRSDDAGDGLVHIVREKGGPDVESDIAKLAYKLVSKEVPLPEMLLRERGDPNQKYTLTVTLAFPTSELKPQLVFAFLPIRSYGFRFVLQADFRLSTTRGDILATDWNRLLRDHVAEAFMASIEDFKSSPHFKNRWIEFVPLSDEVTDPFFKPVEAAIRTRLAKTDCVLCEGNRWLPPSKVLLPPPSALRGLLAPAEVFTMLGKGVVSGELSKRSTDVLVALGASSFSLRHVVEYLANPDTKAIIAKKSPDWFLRLYSCLGGGLAQRQVTLEVLRPLPMLLLEGNRITTAESGALLPADSDTSGTTFGFEHTMPYVHSALLKQQSGMAFLRSVGVTPAMPFHIITMQLLPKLETMSPEIAVAAMRYMKAHEHVLPPEALAQRGLKLLGTDGKLYRPVDLLIPSPINAFPVQEFLAPRFNILSPLYLPASSSPAVCLEWRNFLKRMGCHLLFQVFRTARGGYHCETLTKMLEPAGFSHNQLWAMRVKLCQALSKLWPELAPLSHDMSAGAFWNQLCNAKWLPGSDNKFHKPADQSLFLRTLTASQLLGANTLYLQADMNVDPAKSLGMRTEMSVGIVLEKLPALRGDVRAFTEVYTFLQSKWMTEGPHIKAAFMEKKMIHWKGQFYGIDECTWAGEPQLLSRVPILVATYPLLKGFFMDALGVVRKPCLGHYIAELDNCRNMRSVNKQTVHALYFEINRCLLVDDPSPEMLAPLGTNTVFLTTTGSWKKASDVIIGDNTNQQMVKPTALMYWDVPLNCLPKVQALMEACGIQTLSNLQPIGGGPDLKTLKLVKHLTTQIRTLVPFLMRYAYFENYEHYLKMAHPWKYFFIQIWQSESLTADYQQAQTRWSSALDFFLKDQGEEAHIFVNQTPERSLPRALGECFGVSPLTIQGMLAAKTATNLNRLLVDLGVGDLPQAELKHLMPPQPLPQSALDALAIVSRPGPAPSSSAVGDKSQDFLTKNALTQGRSQLKQQITQKKQREHIERAQAADLHRQRMHSMRPRTYSPPTLRVKGMPARPAQRKGIFPSARDEVGDGETVEVVRTTPLTQAPGMKRGREGSQEHIDLESTPQDDEQPQLTIKAPSKKDLMKITLEGADLGESGYGDDDGPDAKKRLLSLIDEPSGAAYVCPDGAVEVGIAPLRTAELLNARLHLPGAAASSGPSEPTPGAARTTAQEWAEKYIQRLLNEEKKQQVKYVNTDRDAGMPYDITFTLGGRLHYVEVLANEGPVFPEVSLPAALWQWAVRHRHCYHLFLVANAGTTTVKVSQLTDPCSVVWASTVPCKVEFALD